MFRHQFGREQEEVQERGYRCLVSRKRVVYGRFVRSHVLQTVLGTAFVFRCSYPHVCVSFILMCAKPCIFMYRIETCGRLPYYRKWLSNKQLYFVAMITVLLTRVWCLFVVRLSAFRGENVNVCHYVPCTMLPLLSILLKCSITVHCDFNCKAKWSLYVPSGLTFNNSTFCPHSCIYVFCVDLRTNSHYFPIQH